MGNYKALDKGFKRAREIMASKLAERFDKSAISSVMTAQNHQQFTNFTGNATTAYAMVRFDGRQREMYSFSSQKYLKAPVFRKIKKGETKFLNPNYDGKPRNVTGKVDLRTSTTKQAIQLVRGIALGQIPIFYAYRFMHPVEYEEYLQDIEPIRVLRQEVMAKMK